jgi:DNA polymerase-3 subunit alpha
MTASFIHLHTHSYFSFLRGLASPESLVEAAVSCGMPALGLADYGWLTGSIEFYQACLHGGVQPVLGLTVEVASPLDLEAYTSHTGGLLVLFAQDMQGWASLCQLSTLVQTNPQGTQVLPFEQVDLHSRGLVCLSGGCESLIARMLQTEEQPAAVAWLDRLAQVFPGRLYGEVQLHTEVDQRWCIALAGLARRLNIPLVASHSVHYLAPGQADLQRVLASMRLVLPLEQLPPEAAAPPEAFFLSPEAIARRFERFPDAVSRTMEVAERCALQLPLGIPHFPTIPLPEGKTVIDFLRHKAEAGGRHLYADSHQALPAAVRERLDHELEVIDRLGYAPLFLVMQQVVTFAHEQGIPLSSRGSAASSLVAHCLGITSPDPLRLNLYFERFLNPARATPPDIDTDLCSRRRDEVIRFIYEHFGVEKVAMVCTISRLRSRSALRETAKAYGLSPSQVSELAESLPRRWYAPGGGGEDDAPYAELVERYAQPIYQAILHDAQALLGLPHHLSVHPGGVVIAPSILTDLAPVFLAPKGMQVTQFDLESIERLGLVKMDLLGIRGLTVLGEVARSAVGMAACIDSAVDARMNQPDQKIQSTSDIQDLPSCDDQHITFLQQAERFLHAIPQQDAQVGELVRQGKTIGCFQIESPGMRATLREVQARTVDDIMVALALYRPGPLTGGLKGAFVRRHQGLEAAEYAHPALEPLLSETYGVILYQEQVLRIAHELAGLSLADSDLLRRAMSHFDPGKQMQNLKERFMTGAWQRHQVPEEIAAQVWEWMAAFAGYGFPKAHAASYALISWRSAWCKLHFPAAFIAAVLANWGGYYSQRVYLMEGRRMGLSLQPPLVNLACREFCTTEYNGQPALVMGLNQVKELTNRTQERIIQGQPYSSFQDFLVRADPRPIEAENLVRAGCLEGHGVIPDLLRQLASGGWRGGQMSLFDLARPIMDDWTLEEKVTAQEAVLGVGVAAHPLELKAEAIARTGAFNTLDAASRVGQVVKVAGMRQTWRRVSTSSGDFIYFMALEDLEGMLDVVIFGEVFRRFRHEFVGHGPYIIEGAVEPDPTSGEPFIRAVKVWRIP